MIGSLTTKVNINFRRFAIRLLAGSSAAVLLSVVTLSDATAAAHRVDAGRLTGVIGADPVVAHHVGVDRLTDFAGGGGLERGNELAGVTARATRVLRAHGAEHLQDVEHVDDVHHARGLHVAVAAHSLGGHLVVEHFDNASHVTSHVAHRVGGGNGGNVSTPYVMDMDYVRGATGIDLYGAPKNWHALAAAHGYYVSDKPVPGGVVCFEGGAYGASDAYGFVAVVVYYQDRGDYWEVGTRYAHAAKGRVYYGRSGVKEQTFRITKNDPRAHYIYRGGVHARPSVYYTRPVYVGHHAAGEEHALTVEAKNVVAVHPQGGQARAYVGPGQVVRVLAKAEVGETIWVFVQTPYRAGVTYAVTSYGGGHRLAEYDDSVPAAVRMYYAKDYGDTVLDLGYADYSRIAGDSGEVTITVKKGDDPARLMPLQTIQLRLAGKVSARQNVK